MQKHQKQANSIISQIVTLKNSKNKPCIMGEVLNTYSFQKAVFCVKNIANSRHKIRAKGNP